MRLQSRLWSQRGTKVNGSHHGDNPLLRPTGIKIATKSYTTLQAMPPTNIKTVHQTSLLHIESSLDRLGLLSPNHGQRSQQQIIEQITLQPVLINKSKFLKTTHTSYKNKENWNTEGHGGVLELVKPAREPASSRPKPCAPLKKPHESCPFAAPCGPRRKKNGRGQRSAFPSETSLFTPLILAHTGYLELWVLEIIWVAHEFGSVKLKLLPIVCPPQ